MNEALAALGAWVAGDAASRGRGLEALGSLPPAEALAAVGLAAIPSDRHADARRLAAAALAADPFRAPHRPLSPAAEVALAAGADLPDRLVAAERAAPAFDASADRPTVLLARGGGFVALGGLFTAPPLIAAGPDGTILACSAGRALLVRMDSTGVEVVREVPAPAHAISAAWHPRLGVVAIGRDGRLVAGASAEPLAPQRFHVPSRVFVAGEAIYVHGRHDPRIQKLEANPSTSLRANGGVRVVMDEPAAAVAIDEKERVVALLRGARRVVAGKRQPPTFRLVRLVAHGPETIAAADGDGEIAMLGDLVFHLTVEDASLTVVDLKTGAIRHLGRLAGGSGVTSMVATPRAVVITQTRSAHLRAYGPTPLDAAPAQPGAAPAGSLTRVPVPANIVALAGRHAILQTGEVLRIEPDGRLQPTTGLVGRSTRFASPLLDGGAIVVPGDGSPLLEIGAAGGVRPLPFSSERIAAAARFGAGQMALATVEGNLTWIDLKRGVVAELRRPGLRALAPMGPHDLLLLHDNGVERLTHPGPGAIVELHKPPVRAVAGWRGGAAGATASGLKAWAPDGSGVGTAALATNRELLLAVVDRGTALVVEKGGSEGTLWRF